MRAPWVAALHRLVSAVLALILICPTQSIITGVFPSPVFPELAPPPVVSGSTPLRLRVYDSDEQLLRDVGSTCNCLSTIPLKELNQVYSNAAAAPFGTYTEIEGGTPGLSVFSFTGYLATKSSGRDSFGRLRNGSRESLRGTLTPGDR